ALSLHDALPILRIEGHTDDQATDAYNRTLSQRRADAVKQVMEGMLTLPGVRLEARGFGESRPKLPNMAEGKPLPKNRAKNRRVEIVYTIKQGGVQATGGTLSPEGAQ